MSPLAAAPRGRIGYADWIKLIATFMVILIHATSTLFLEEPINSTAFLVSWLLDCLSHAAVPLFVMVSGMFLLDESRTVTVRQMLLKNVLPMAGLFLLWSFLYALINKCVQPIVFENAAFDGAMVRDFLKAIIEGTYHMWYIPMLIGLYLITPLLRCFVRRDNLPAVRWFLVLALVFQLIMPTGMMVVRELTSYNPQPQYNSFYFCFACGYAGYYVAGWYLANCRPARRAPVWIGGAVSLLLLLGMTYWFSARRQQGYKYFMEYSSLFTGGYSVALFALLAWNVKKPAPRWVTALSRLSFGVYIVHVEVQALLKVLFPYDGRWAVYLLIQWGATAVISFVGCYILSKIPVLRRCIRT